MRVNCDRVLRSLLQIVVLVLRAAFSLWCVSDTCSISGVLEFGTEAGMSSAPRVSTSGRTWGPAGLGDERGAAVRRLPRALGALRHFEALDVQCAAQRRAGRDYMGWTTRMGFYPPPLPGAPPPSPFLKAPDLGANPCKEVRKVWEVWSVGLVLGWAPDPSTSRARRVGI